MSWRLPHPRPSPLVEAYTRRRKRVTLFGHYLREAIVLNLCPIARGCFRRHTFATDLYRDTKDLLVVRDALGHADTKTTEIYTHLNNDELRRAMQKLRAKKRRPK
ncbi:MAG: hypothetical protein FJ135_12210 [Deltaproteobacteria bacterium]|nr:hypothetical protein [Deltaproteobacteria bacterium]